VNNVPLDILDEKRRIALAIRSAVGKVKGVSLVQRPMVGASYPYNLDVPGVWVHGPDAKGRYGVIVSIIVSGMRISEAANKLRSEIWGELDRRGYAGHVTSIDIRVEDLIMAV